MSEHRCDHCSPLRLMSDGIAALKTDVRRLPVERLRDAEEVMRYMGVGLWCLAGFPALEIGHKLAAALMCTEPSSDAQTPWESFLLYVPGGLIPYPHGPGMLAEQSDVSHVLVTRHSDRWVLLVCSGQSWALRMNGTTVQLLASIRPPSAAQVDATGADAFVADAWGDRGWRAAAHRTAVLVVRYVVNACLMLASSPSRVQRVGKGCALEPFSAGNRRAVEPKTQLFRFGAPVGIDCREAVREYASGMRSSTPRVQWIVRGHWTHQPHGPGRALRRLQWIEPYWKGHEGAPVNVRSHVMGEA